jgi:hypothetical protein
MSIVGELTEIRGVAWVCSGGAAVGGVRSVPDRIARSQSERAAPPARVGKSVIARPQKGAEIYFGA